LWLKHYGEKQQHRENCVRPMGRSSETIFLTSYVGIHEDCCGNLVEQENQAAIIARWQVEEDENNYTEALKSAFVECLP